MGAAHRNYSYSSVGVCTIDRPALETDDSRYISNVLSLMREHRRLFLSTMLAGLALRLLFFNYFPAVTDDSRVYVDLATNWMQHGVYGETELGQIVPSDTRLPGYPAFLAAIFAVFGPGNIRAVLLIQVLLDLGTCLILADLARRIMGRRAAMITFVLAALCPFTANYAAAVLTETLEVFFTALALDCAAAALDPMDAPGAFPTACPWWCAAGASIGACILLRPDGGILLAAVGFFLAILALEGMHGFRKVSRSLERGFVAQPALPKPRPATRTSRLWKLLVVEVILGVFALGPLGPWTIRNLRTLHHFQPLAPRYATDSDEIVPRGFNRWAGTWTADYASVEEVYWNVPGDKIDVEKLPSRALDTARDATLALIADYNQNQKLTPQLDARFGELAAQRVRAHPIRSYAELPLLRIADMWLRPRTELLPADPRWWEFNDDRRWLALTLAFGVLNLGYILAALGGLIRRHSEIRYLGLLVGFVLLRSAFLGTIENPEPRYTLECYPVIIVLAAAFLASRGQKSTSDRQRTLAV
jgi:hypothetical protein